MGRPTERFALAAELFPDSPSAEAGNALRQSLHRLRKWLGDGAISCSGRSVELSPCCWTVIPDVFSEEKVEGALLVGVLHPALEKYRSLWSRSRGVSLDETAQALVSAVTTIAPHDRFAARAIFVSGGAIINRVGLEDLRKLLEATKPGPSECLHGLQYYEQQGFYYMRQACVKGVITSFTRAFRISERLRDSAGRSRMASELACAFIELGEMQRAAYWLDKVRVGKNPSSNLMIETSRASFHWNQGHCTAALETMDEARTYLPEADRPSVARFWVNYSLLSAEAGRSKASEDAVLRADELTKSAGPIVQSTLRVARAIQLASSGKLYDSIDLLTETLQTTVSFEHRMGAMYIEEALAEVYASAGCSADAKNTWRSAQAKRSAKLNPRNLARYRRILAFCS